MFLVSSCSCLCSIYWIQVLSWEWRCSWSSTDRRCSNYIWIINNFIAYKDVTYFYGSQNFSIQTLWKTFSWHYNDWHIILLHFEQTFDQHSSRIYYVNFDWLCILVQFIWNSCIINIYNHKIHTIKSIPISDSFRTHLKITKNLNQTRQIRTPVLRIPPAVTSQAKMKNWLHECQKWVSHMIGHYTHI